MRTVKIEVTRTSGFDALLEARQRLRSLVLEFDPECATWGAPRRPSVEGARVDRPLSLALLGIHDLIERGIDESIEQTGEIERLRPPDEPENE